MRVQCTRSARAVAIVAAIVVSLSSAAAPGASPTRPARRANERGTPPHVVYSTLLGGAAGNYDAAIDVAVDATGNAIIVGQTESEDFPTKNALRSSFEGSQEAFVAKFDPDGDLVFSTFLGGDEADSAAAVAVDSSGAIYVAGLTGSPDFPIKDAAQPIPGGAADAFVTKISADGSQIVYSTRLGGSGTDRVRDLAVDALGRAYVTGEVEPVSGTTATFPSVSAAQGEYGGGESDGFVSVISPEGNALLYSTLFDGGVQEGGPRFGRERVSSILVDSESGNVFLSGNVEFDEDEPETPFVAALRPPDERGRMTRDPQISGAFFLYMALGGANGNINRTEKTILGTVLYLELLRATKSQGETDGPGAFVLVTGYCPEAPSNGTCDRAASLVTFDPQLAEVGDSDLDLLHEFFFDVGTGDSQNAVYIAGDIHADRVTTLNPIQPAFGGNDDVVLAVLEPGTLRKVMVSYFGGDGFDLPTSIATDAAGNVYVCGLTTLTTTFPTTPGAFQSIPKGRNDAFLVKISPFGPFPDAPDFALSFAQPTVQVQRGTKVSMTLSIDRVGGFDGNVKVKPPAQVPGFKSPKKSPSVPGNSVVLKFKIKQDAPVGQTSFRFTGTDSDGRSRSATVTLDVQ